jgi:hypothetical protein
MLLGWLLGLAQRLVDGMLSAFFGSFVVRNWSTVFLPGVVMHESAHAVFLTVTGAQVTEVVVREGTRHPWTLYRRRGSLPTPCHAAGLAGHVSYRRRGGFVLESFQRVLGSLAPTIVGIACIAACGNALASICTLWWHYAFFVYLLICALNGATLSAVDIREMLPGIPLCMLILFLVCWITGFDATSMLPAAVRSNGAALLAL